MSAVSLVIPGRNAAKTIRPCLEAVIPLLRNGQLAEILFVDDGSRDETPAIVQSFSEVTYVRGPGRGPGAARNLGWQSAKSPLVWFIDSDCVAEPDALRLLLPHLNDAKVGGVSGSYGNMRPDSLLACLIHEEIVERHRRMSHRVNFAATFNVLYRRAILEQLGGFDERFLKGQDAELSWRVLEAGWELGFELQSRVKHFHEDAWLGYLRTQRQQGYWRVFLHTAHKGHSRGDSYSSLIDHAQPFVAAAAIGGLVAGPILARWMPPLAWIWLASGWLPVTILAALQVPQTWRLYSRTRDRRMLLFGWMGFLRAFWRGVGAAHGAMAMLFGGGGGRAKAPVGREQRSG